MNCPVCGSDKPVFYRQQSQWSYFICSRCQTLFLNPPPSSKFLNHYYRCEFQYATSPKDENSIRKQAKKIIHNLQKINPQATNILDIGSGWGFLLDEARKLGLKTIGVEPSRQLADFSIRKLKLKVVNTPLEKFYDSNHSKFDLIVMSHVIEHVLHPAEFLRKVAYLLSKEGVLYIETPNLDSWLFRVEQENYPFLTPPDHLWIFSPKSFFYLTNSTSLRLLRLDTYSHSQHLAGITKRIIKGKSRPKKKNSIAKFKKTTLPVANHGLKKLKFWLFDRLFANLFLPLMNFNHQGSILQTYWRKK